jgi:hypothetical protein
MAPTGASSTPCWSTAPCPTSRPSSTRASARSSAPRVPTHSWSAWPSFLTGVDPDDHGVYDILETKPGTHKQYPVTYRSIKARTFLDDFTAAGQNQLLLDVRLAAAASLRLS